MRKFLKNLKIFFFIFLTLGLILGFGLEVLSSFANAQDFVIEVDKNRWDQIQSSKFNDESVVNSKICTLGEREGRDGETTLPRRHTTIKHG